MYFIGKICWKISVDGSSLTFHLYNIPVLLRLPQRFDNVSQKIIRKCCNDFNDGNFEEIDQMAYSLRGSSEQIFIDKKGQCIFWLPFILISV